MSKYKVIYSGDLEDNDILLACAGIRRDPVWGDEGNILVDPDGNYVGSDGGEPEDQTLCRNWRWVVEVLNKNLDEYNRLKNEAQLLRNVVESVAELLGILDNALKQEWEARLWAQKMAAYNLQTKIVDALREYTGLGDTLPDNDSSEII